MYFVHNFKLITNITQDDIMINILTVKEVLMHRWVLFKIISKSVSFICSYRITEFKEAITNLLISGRCISALTRLSRKWKYKDVESQVNAVIHLLDLTKVPHNSIEEIKLHTSNHICFDSDTERYVSLT